MTPRSRLVGLIGSSIQSSRTPGMHEHEAWHHGLPYVYRLIDLDTLGRGAEALPELLNRAEQFGFDGLNITHPCKQAVLPLLHELSDDARTIGAVNTVVLRAGRRIGHNTDWWGFFEAFQQGLPGANLNLVVQLGAGGAGAAVAHALLTLGVSHLALFDTDVGRAAQLAAALRGSFGKGRVQHVEDLSAVQQADGLVNATPVGMAAYPGMPLPKSILRPALWVAEIIYFPMETELLRTARAMGCKTMDGGGMAVYQAVEAFRLFTGIRPDARRMREQFLALGRAV
ncbi:MAG: shikimate dehydrogenase [Burkholderiales bacterium]